MIIVIMRGNIEMQVKCSLVYMGTNHNGPWLMVRKQTEVRAIVKPELPRLQAKFQFSCPSYFEDLNCRFHYVILNAKLLNCACILGKKRNFNILSFLTEFLQNPM